jgi:hypothetical protein
MTAFASLIRLLAQHDVQYVVVGGAAATAHGAARLMQALDIVYRRGPDNFAKLASSRTSVLTRCRHYSERIKLYTHYRSGDLDLLGEITGGGGYDDLLPHTVMLNLFGVTCRCLELRRLIEVKRAAGRPKDLEAIAELEALHEENEKA